MTNATRRAVLLAALWLTACGAPASGTISGKVTFADGSESNGLTVLLLGATGKQATTSGGGAYSFDKLPQGVYLISVEAADSKEGKLSFGTESDGAKMISAPDLVFHAVGSLSGKVNDALGPAAGATVYLSGSDKVALTDSMGNFTFSDVPAGEYSLVAKAGGQFPQTATAEKVKVKRGKNDAMPLTLANDLALTGKLEGRVALFGGTSPGMIKVAVASISAMTDDTGKFTLTLPPGDYEPIAELAGYPKPQSLGIGTVRAGFTTTLPTKTLSIYKTFPWESRITSVSIPLVSESDTAVLTVNVGTDYFVEHYFVDTKTFERRLFLLGSYSAIALSKNGKWAAYVPTSGRGVVAVNSLTGQTHSVGSDLLSAGPVISNDESTLMFYAGAPQNQLVKLDLNSGNVTTTPAFSGSFFQTNERFLAVSATTSPFDVALVTPTGSNTVFNNMQVLTGTAYQSFTPSVSGPQVAFAYTCAAACSVMVLGASANAASQVSAIPAAPSVIAGSVKDWLGLSWAGVTPGRILVKVSDGSNTTLPANTTQLIFNETLARVVTYSLNGIAYDVREDVVPPSATSTVHFTSPTTPNGAWLSPSRFMVFGTGPTKRVEIKGGVASTGDTDVTIDGTMQSPLFFPPGVMWVKTSTSKRVTAVYDSPTDLLPDALGANASFSFTSLGSRAMVLGGGLGKYAAFSDSTSMFVLDGDKNEVKKVGPGTFINNSAPFVVTDRMKVSRNAGTGLQFFASGKVISLSEPGLTLSFNGTASLPKGGTFSVSVMAAEPRNALSMANTP